MTCAVKETGSRPRPHFPLPWEFVAVAGAATSLSRDGRGRGGGRPAPLLLLALPSPGLRTGACARGAPGGLSWDHHVLDAAPPVGAIRAL